MNPLDDLPSHYKKEIKWQNVAENLKDVSFESLSDEMNLSNGYIYDF